MLLKLDLPPLNLANIWWIYAVSYMYSFINNLSIYLKNKFPWKLLLIFYLLTKNVWSLDLELKNFTHVGRIIHVGVSHFQKVHCDFVNHLSLHDVDHYTCIILSKVTYIDKSSQ